MVQEPFIFRALRQQLLWPSIHAAVDVYQRRRAAAADHYELIWRLVHICECTVITLAAASISRLRDIGNGQDLRAWWRDGSVGQASVISSNSFTPYNGLAIRRRVLNCLQNFLLYSSLQRVTNQLFFEHNRGGDHSFPAKSTPPGADSRTQGHIGVWAGTCKTIESPRE